MKNIIFVVFVFLFSVSNAQALIQKDSGTSYHHQLLDLYKLGTEPTKEQVDGWWSGRCYMAKKQNEAISAIFVATEVITDNQDHGPLFQDKKKTFNFQIFVRNSGSESYFDKLDEETKRRLEASIEDSEFKDLVAHYENGSLVVEGVKLNLKHELRSYGKYFISVSTILKDVGVLKKGDVYAACYYFLKVK